MPLTKTQKISIIVTVVLVVVAAIVILTVFLTLKPKASAALPRLKKTSNYAFIYVGQLRTWQFCIPKWREIFAKLKPGF
jgi:flagellar basal body-associated protein FliL